MINILRASVLEDGCTFTPAITDEEDPQHQAAVDMADWMTKAFALMSPKLDVVLWDLCMAFAVGNRVAEIVWEVMPDPMTKRPGLLIKAIKCKPRESVGFVVDSYNNLLGILALEVGRAWPVQTNVYVADLETIPNLLPRGKFCILTFRPVNDDPRGTTPLRQAYDPWWLARQSRINELAFIAQFAGPSLIGYTPELAEPITTDQSGNPLPEGMTLSPQWAMAQTLATVKNGTAIALPFGSKVEPLQMHGDGAAFANFEQTQDKRIAKAILWQTLATEESKHQTRASTGQHKDLVDTNVRMIRGNVEDMIAEQIMAPLVLYNFGEEALALLPAPVLGRTEQHDFAETAKGVAELQGSGFIGDSQKPGIDKMLGLPVRDVEADAQAAAAALQAAQALAAANPVDAAQQSTASRQAAGGQVAGEQAGGATKAGETTPPADAQAAQKQQQKGAA